MSCCAVCYSLVWCGLSITWNLLICDPTATDLTSPRPARAPLFPLPHPPPPSSLCPVVIQDGDTALHKAARWGHLDCLEVLVTKGAKVNAKNKVSGE